MGHKRPQIPRTFSKIAKRQKGYIGFKMDQYSKKTGITGHRRRETSSHKVPRTSAEFKQYPGSPRESFPNKNSDPLTHPSLFSEVGIQAFSFSKAPSNSYRKRKKK